MARHFEEMEPEFSSDITADEIENLLNDAIPNRRTRPKNVRRRNTPGTLGFRVINGRILNN